MKTPLDRLAQNLEKVLQEYVDDVNKDVERLTTEFGKKGAQAAKQESANVFGSGRYSKGWKSTLQKSRLSTVAVIHNTTPGLPHLLEHGHANRGGGRTSGKEHLAPVEEKLVKEYRKAVENDL